MNPLEKFYTDNPKWYEKIGAIHALLERVKISEEQSGSVLHLRRRNRILSIHSSTSLGAAQRHSGGAKRLAGLRRDAGLQPVVGG